MDPLLEIKTTLETIKGKAGEVDGVKADIETLKRSFEDLEAVISRPAGNGGGEYVSPQQKEHADTFAKWLRNPRDMEIRAQLRALETKTASGLSDSSGGALVPELIVNQILKRLKDGSVIRSLASVRSVGTSDVKMILSNNEASSAWVGETGTRSQTTEPTIEPRSPTFGTLYSYVYTTEELAMDSQFDIASWFSDAIADEMIVQEGVAFISGNGSNKPTGMLNTSPSSAGDNDSPARNVAAFKYVPTGVAGAFPADMLGSPASNPADVLVDTVYDLRAPYRRNASWLMNSATAGVLRKWKDADGRHIWTDSLAAGQPARLMGYPVAIDEAMPDIGSNTFPVGFGDFSRGYGIFDLGGLRITIDDNITTPGLVKYYFRKRVGGCVLNNNAVRFIKCAAS
ncbi:phage major capsid protein [Albidovulum sediminis]|uniref:Phage major capsid protein n=1 Tax=Albidovulum sediminis TaxID=3066345 RepID=A0ABT2NH81_9RHOB|nr:phage major capsid protein [Defluviimonas sediminis]MCT8328269.1 phage major capsid protein [Defluviimonas sediminis]